MARPRSDIAPRILHAARERFLSQGVDGASLREIARAAGTSIGMIYYYFPTKEALFLGVVEEVYARVLRDLEEALAPDVPVEQRLRRVSRRVGDMSDDEFTIIRLIIREALVSSERRAMLLERFGRGHLPLVFQTILEGRSNGAITDRHHPFALVLSILGIMFVPQVVSRLGGDTRMAALGAPSGTDLSDMLTDVLFHGIAGPARAEAKTDPEPEPSRS